jgi:hypothetical protein
LILTHSAVAITPSLAAAAEEALINFRDGGMATYTGSDVRVIIELASPGAGAPRFSKQLLEVTTLTVSCHRVKTPAVACGYQTRGYRPVAQQETRAHARRSRTRSFFMDNAQRPSSTIMVASLAARVFRSCSPVWQPESFDPGRLLTSARPAAVLASELPVAQQQVRAHARVGSRAGGRSPGVGRSGKFATYLWAGKPISDLDARSGP